MRKMMLAALAATMTLCGTAKSAVLTYNLNGIFSDGATLSGGFSFDDQETGFAEFSNVAVKVTGTNSFTVTTVSVTTGSATPASDAPFTIGFNDLSGLRVGFYADNNSFLNLRAITSTDLITSGDFSTSYLASGVRVNLVSGTITQSAAPEPASWAMMIGGFGLIGTVMRRRKVAVSFA